MRFSPVETEGGVGVNFLEFIGVRPKGQDENRLKNDHLVEKPPFSLSIHSLKIISTYMHVS